MFRQVQLFGGPAHGKLVNLDNNCNSVNVAESCPPIVTMLRPQSAMKSASIKLYTYWREDLRQNNLYYRPSVPRPSNASASD